MRKLHELKLAKQEAAIKICYATKGSIEWYELFELIHMLNEEIIVAQELEIATKLVKSSHLRRVS